MFFINASFIALTFAHAVPTFLSNKISWLGDLDALEKGQGTQLPMENAVGRQYFCLLDNLLNSIRPISTKEGGGRV